MKRLAFWALALSTGLLAENALYVPFGKPGFLTSSFGENRGTRYHAGIDYSTDMREGFPVIAPEDGKISQVRLSPYGYGKVVYFQGKSGKTWVFAHQSGFSRAIDSLVRDTQSKTGKNDVSIANPDIPGFRQGDTISFTGSSGIGNPHLHLEIRLGDKIINPCRNGTLCQDTLDPLVLGAAVFQKESVALSGEEDLKAGCIEIPDIDDFENPIRFVFKIADYSRYPLENPMSVRRVTLRKKDKVIDEITKDTLSLANMIQIRKELLWAEEADTAGDWHYLPGEFFRSPDDTLTLETEDMVGRISTRTFAFKEKCGGTKPAMQGKFQRPELFSFLSRTWLGLDLCASDIKQTGFLLLEKGKKPLNLCEEFPARPITLGEILERHPKAEAVLVERDGRLDTIAVKKVPKGIRNLSWKLDRHFFPVSEKITGLAPVPWTQVLAVRRLESDSVPAFEFHPKGLHFRGSWQVSFYGNIAEKPLYYLGETSRRWFIFGKQRKRNLVRSTSANELRDVGFISDTTAPEVGEIRMDKAFVAGTEQTVIRIPLIERESGIANGNAIKAFSREKPFIYAEYDSEPHEIVLVPSDLPSPGKSFFLSIQDEAGNRKTFEIPVPSPGTPQ